MAYINQILAVVFLAVAIAPLLAQPPSPNFSSMTPECALVLPDLLQKCFVTGSVTPTEDCCSDLKSATTTQVTCLCDNYIADPAFVTYTKPYAAAITSKCGVLDKYSCGSTSKGGGSGTGTGNGTGTGSSSNGKSNIGATNKIASMAVFGLVASLVFVMF